MDKNYLIQLTNNLYRLTLLFPKKEPLRYKMREIADDILAKCLIPGIKQNSQEGLVENLEILDGFFEVAKNQNWVSPTELLRLQEEYSRIKAEIKKIPKKPTEVRPPEFCPEVRPQDKSLPGEKEIVGARPVLNVRQEKILEILKENCRAQVKDIKKIFPEVSKRTLRRDFGFLLKKGIIERMGKRNETFYQLR